MEEKEIKLIEEFLCLGKNIITEQDELINSKLNEKKYLDKYNLITIKANDFIKKLNPFVNYLCDKEQAPDIEERKLINYLDEIVDKLKNNLELIILIRQKKRGAAIH